MLAEKIGCDPLEITNLNLKRSPTERVLLYAMRKDITIGKLEHMLLEMERHDVLEDCKHIIGDKL